MAIVGADHRPELVNPALSRILKRDHNSLCQLPLPEVIHPDERGSEVGLFQEVAAGIRQGYRMERRFLTPEGRVVRGWLSVTGLPEQEGEEARAIALVEDVTDRKEAEASLRERERDLEAILDHLPAMLFLKDAENLCFERFNAAGEKLLGRSREEFIGRSDYDFFPREQADSFTQRDREVIASGQPVEIPEEPIQTPGGERILHTRKAPIIDRQGRARYLLGVSEDITEKVRAGQELERERNLARALSEILLLLVGPIPEPEAIFEAVCRIAVERGGLALAWIGVETEGGWVSPEAAYGAGKGYVREVQVSADPGRPEGQGPVGHAIRGGEPVVIQDLLEDPSMAPWHQTARQHVLRAIAAFPLSRGGQVIGTLSVYAGRTDFFSDRLQGLLEKLATALSGALDRYDRETERLALQGERDRLAEALDQSADLVWIARPSGEIIYANSALERALGCTSGKAVGRPVTDLFGASSEDVGLATILQNVLETGESQREVITFRQPEGEVLHLDENLSVLRDPDGSVTYLVGTGRDVTQPLALQRQLHELAYYDPLTGLANRSHFQERLQHALDQVGRRGERLAVLIMDLDRFKDINDSLGHQFGDRVIEAFADKVQGCLQTEDTLARYGGDELIVLLERLTHPRWAGQVAERILDVLREPVMVEGTDFRLGASMGIALYPENGDHPQELIRHADTAMYQAKGQGGQGYQFFDAPMAEEVSERLFLTRELGRALENDALSVFYQPVFECQGEHLVGLEALARWHHPERGWISPGIFIPVAEEIGLIGEVDTCVRKQVLRQARRWRDQGLRVPRIAANASTLELKEPGFPGKVLRELKEAGLPPTGLELEVTEGTFLEPGSAPEAALRELRGMGVSVAIDDFGTGYSSLAYIGRLPADRLKVDQVFVRDVATTAGNQTLFSAATALARGFGLTLLAEGIETREEADFLAGLGCQEGQGYHFAPPLPPEEAAAFLPREEA